MKQNTTSASPGMDFLDFQHSSSTPPPSNSQGGSQRPMGNGMGSGMGRGNGLDGFDAFSNIGSGGSQQYNRGGRR